MSAERSNDAQAMVVLIPTYGRGALLRRTVESVARCRPPAGQSVEIWVVENGEKADVEEMLGKIDTPMPLLYRHHPVSNKSAALNSVLTALAGRWIVFLDDDVRVDQALLEGYGVAMAESQRGSFFGGAMLVDYEVEPPAWLKRYLPPSAKGWRPLPEEVDTRVGFFGCNWAASADDLLAAGGFDAGLGPGAGNRATGQEMDMQRRLKARGLRPVYLPDAIVWHYVPTDRCSPEWALERARKMSANSATRLPDSVLRRRIGGTPMWVIRALIESAVMSALTWPLGQEPHFAARFRLNQSLGTLDGLRLRRTVDRTRM